MSKNIETNKYIWYNTNKAKVHAQVIGTSVRAPGVRRHQRVCENRCGCQRWAVHNGMALVYIQMPEGCLQIECHTGWPPVWCSVVCSLPAFLGGIRLKKKNRNAAPRCPYCGSPAILRSADGIYINNSKKTMLYVCKKYPLCDSYVRVHPGTNIPMGTLANGTLRRLRREAHKKFDQLHKLGLMT